MAKKKGGVTHGKIGQTEWEQVSLFDIYLMGDEHERNENDVEREESTNVFSTGSESNVRNTDSTINASIRDDVSRSETRDSINNSRTDGIRLQSEIKSKQTENRYNQSENDSMGGKSINNDYQADIQQVGNYRLEVGNDTTQNRDEKLNNNINAINLLRFLQSHHSEVTLEQQTILSKYSGWGGLPHIFNESNLDYNEQRNLLKSILSIDEYQNARASTLTSFYTPLNIIQNIYDLVEHLGFKSGKILEPSCGIGNFFGMMPLDMQNDSSVYGVELDTVTGQIAQNLYPNFNIQVKGFENANIPNNYFDLVISNVPFGNYKIHDIDFDQYSFNIHDYFFAKSLSKVRNGGIICFITSTTTMDKSPKILEYINKHADFIGAVRLPTNTFNTNGANTSVTSDLIIIQRNDNKEKDIVYENDVPNWMKYDYFSPNLRINKYFLDNPDMILGNPIESKGNFNSYFMRVNQDALSFEEHFNKALNNISRNIYYDEEIVLAEYELPIDEQSINIPYNTFFVYNEKVYQKKNDVCQLIDDSDLNTRRRIDLINIAETAKEVIDIQSSNQFSEDIYLSLRNNLNRQYDYFVKKYNYINSRNIKTLLEGDPRQYLVLNLESKGEKQNTYIKSDIFTQRTIKPVREVKSVSTLRDAIFSSLNIKGQLDLEYMSVIYNKNLNNLEDELNESLMTFYNPEMDRWELESEYLSGNIRNKIEYLDNNNLKETYVKNYDALQNVMPEPLLITDITFQLGSPYIPIYIYEEFLEHIFKFNNYATYNKSKAVSVNYVQLSGKYAIDIQKYMFYNNSVLNSEWGVPISSNIDSNKSQPEYNGFDLFENIINSTIPTIRNYWYEEDYNTGDTKRKSEVNSERTTQARELAENLEEEFIEFVLQNEKYVKDLEDAYNYNFNTIRPREYNGSFLNFPQMNQLFELEGYQKDAIARIIYGNNTLLSQRVGAGKTFEMVASGMEMKRMGKRDKILYVVPNHLIEQWRNEFLQLYPQANILAITSNDFGAKNRAMFINKIATNNYDAIIMAHSSFKLIPMDRDIQIKMLDEEIKQLATAIEEARTNDYHENGAVKMLERSKKAIESNVKKLTDIKRDDGITFDKLGIDFLFVDEAHEFKNLYTYSAMKNIAGVPQTKSQKASDMHMKCRFIQNSGGGVCFATGTPITNTMAELFTMQRYLQQEELERLGINNFDGWAKTFGKVVTSLEVSVDGSGFQTRQRFNKFFNIPELMTVFREVATIQTESMLNKALRESPLQRERAIPPAHIGGKPQIIQIEPSNDLEEYIADVVERTERIHNREVSPNEDNMLKVTTDSKKASIDLRLINEDYGITGDNKLLAIADNIYNIYNEYNESKATQLVFCDSSTPKDGFNVYNSIKDDLVDRGIPSEEIAFIHDYNTSIRKEKLYRDVNNGNVRVLLGSTAKLGAGTNVQKRMIAIHHVDVPWRASDIEQRNGRVFRQGNIFDEIYEFRYATKKSFDAYSWQLVETKSTYMNQLLEGSGNAREIEEDTQATFSYAEIKAIASGNPLIKEKLEVDTRLKQVETSLTRHRIAIRKAQDEKMYLPEKIKSTQTKIDNMKEDYLLFKDNINYDNEFNLERVFKIILNNKTYTDFKEYGDLLLEMINNPNNNKKNIHIGTMYGFDFFLENDFATGWNIYFMGKSQYSYPIEHLHQVGRVNANRMCKGLLQVNERFIKLNGSINADKENYKNLDSIINKPFENQDELIELRKRQKEINKLLTSSNNSVVLNEDKNLEEDFEC